MKEKLRQALSLWQKQSIVMPDRVPSAVLLPIYYKEGEYYLLFIKRTEKVKEHKGQISFPGGTYEERDGILLATALRESTEEIGLAPADVEILGVLDDTPTLTSSYIITPFVAFIPSPYQFKVDSEEIEEMIEIPISALRHEGAMHMETEIINGEEITSYTYYYKGRVIWGATARILNQFLDIWTEVMKTSKAG